MSLEILKQKVSKSFLGITQKSSSTREPGIWPADPRGLSLSVYSLRKGNAIPSSTGRLVHSVVSTPGGQSDDHSSWWELSMPRLAEKHADVCVPHSLQNPPADMMGWGQTWMWPGSSYLFKRLIMEILLSGWKECDDLTQVNKVLFPRHVRGEIVQPELC